MADYSVRIDNDLNLSGNEQRCEVEQDAGYRLDIIKYGTVVHEEKVFPVNNAEFFFESSYKILNDLHFVEVGTGDPASITEEKKKAGWIPICDSEIYVNKRLKRVLVFGRKS